jgi:hypothetical protein
VIAGEIGYVIGRGRTTTPAPLRSSVGAGDLTVAQAVMRSQENRILALQAAANGTAGQLAQSQQSLTDAQAKLAAPTTVDLPLGAFDILGGAAAAAYSGTLSLTACDGFNDASACSADNHLGFTVGRAADGSLTLSSALFENAPLARDGVSLHAQGPVANPAYAVNCNGEVTATFFDAQLAIDHLSMTDGTPTVVSFTVTFAMTVPAGGPCPQHSQVVYSGSMTRA